MTTSLERSRRFLIGQKCSTKNLQVTDSQIKSEFYTQILNVKIIFQAIVKQFFTFLKNDQKITG